jgi:RnfABCDGE-type electron transport complex B subunit
MIDWTIIIISVAVLSFLGIFLGVILGFASKFFAVWEDPKVQQIEGILPGANCGACGFAGCHAYAVALAAGKADPDLCRPGAQKAAEAIGKILGVEVKSKEQMVAQRYCNGGDKEAKVKFDYEGIMTCKAASIVNNGFKACSYSCLGLGDCSLVCPVNAITMDDDSLPQIDKDKCIACEKCVKECPRGILSMAPKKALVHVRCRSKDPGKIATKVCSVGCIACKLCEKACKFDAIHVVDNLAIIDYSKCTMCGECVKVCPRKIIIQEPAPPKQEEKKDKKDEENKDEEKKEEK